MQPLLDLGLLALPHVFSLKIEQCKTKNSVKFQYFDKLEQTAMICYKEFHGEELLGAPQSVYRTYWKYIHKCHVHTPLFHWETEFVTCPHYHIWTPSLELFLITSCWAHTEADRDGHQPAMQRLLCCQQWRGEQCPARSALGCLLCSAQTACLISLGWLNSHSKEVPW